MLRTKNNSSSTNNISSHLDHHFQRKQHRKHVVGDSEKLAFLHRQQSTLNDKLKLFVSNSGVYLPRCSRYTQTTPSPLLLFFPHLHLLSFLPILIVALPNHILPFQRFLCLLYVLCFRIVHPSVHPSVRPAVSLSVCPSGRPWSVNTYFA